MTATDLASVLLIACLLGAVVASATLLIDTLSNHRHPKVFDTDRLPQPGERETRHRLEQYATGELDLTAQGYEPRYSDTAELDLLPMPEVRSPMPQGEVVSLSHDAETPTGGRTVNADSPSPGRTGLS